MLFSRRAPTLLIYRAPDYRRGLNGSAASRAANRTRDEAGGHEHQRGRLRCGRREKVVACVSKKPRAAWFGLQTQRDSAAASDRNLEEKRRLDGTVKVAGHSKRSADGDGRVSPGWQEDQP